MSIASKSFTDIDLVIRSKSLIAQGALTNSKRPECLVRGIYPTHLERSQGCFVWDAKGNRWIDFIGGLGSSILGYAQHDVNSAMMEQMQKGTTFSLGTEIELRVAEKVQEMFPFVERVKILKTGSDACSAAIRIARAYTDRVHIVSEGYHGFHDSFVSLTKPALGVKDSFFFESRHDLIPYGNVAAVIIEPIVTDISQERVEWLRDLRKKCTESGTLLIFDEIITGFRFPKYSTASYYGIEPDLICIGKAMANGMPVSVVGGKEKVMNCGEYFVSTTFAGETVSLAAALRTMTLLQKKFSLDFLWEKGGQFLKKFNSLWPDAIRIEGYPTRGVFRGDDMIKAIFWQEACRAGLLFGPSWLFNFSHIEHMDAVLNTVSDIITKIKTGSVNLDGEMPVSPFAQKQREQKT